jgi:Tfp pilus assembly protein PilF
VQQVEMLCVLPHAGISRLRAKFLLIVLLNFALVAYTVVAKAQNPSLAATEGSISGTVLLNAGHGPAGQVAVSLNSHVTGMFRTMLTDVEGHFEVRGLPPGAYDIVVDEPGYESAHSSAQLAGPSADLVIYLKSSKVAEIRRDNDTVSVHALKIPGKAHNELQEGLQRLAKNDPAGALSHLNKAVEVSPDFYEAYCQLGVAETKLGHRDEAMRAFQTSVDLSGGRYALAQFGLGYLLYLEGNPREAETIVRKGLEADENSADGYTILGMIQLKLEHPDDAEKSALEALLRKPDFALAYLVLADAYGHQGDRRMQLRELGAYLKLDPAGPAHDLVQQSCEVVLRILTQSRAPN